MNIKKILTDKKDGKNTEMLHKKPQKFITIEMTQMF